MRRLIDTIREGFNAVGLDLRRYEPETTPLFRLSKALHRFDIELVVDVGANTGQFASELRSAGYLHEILSFEPLAKAHRTLIAAAARDPKWQVHPRCAIGSRDGEIEINVSANSVSSSVLPMLDTHASAAPDSQYIRSERVPIAKLDTVLPTHLRPGCRTFIKIDTQGYEWEVLEGARQTLHAISGILCELSLVPLYANQRLWTEMLDRMKREGFSLWSIQTGFTDPRDGRTLQVDATFFRTDAVLRRKRMS